MPRRAALYCSLSTPTRLFQQSPLVPADHHDERCIHVSGKQIARTARATINNNLATSVSHTPVPLHAVKPIYISHSKDAVTSMQRPAPTEAMNVVSNHPKLRATLRFAETLFVAGTAIAGKLEVECKADKGLAMGAVYVELFGIEGMFLSMLRDFQC